MNKTEANRLLSPGDLWQVSKSEAERRRGAARHLGEGAWATVTDPEAVKTIGARHVQVVSVVSGDATSSTRIVRPFYSTAQHSIRRDDLAECLALGDRVTVGSKRGIVCSVVPDEAASTALILTPDWGIDGREADQPAITEECPAADVSGRASGSDPAAHDDVRTTPTLESANGLFVRGARRGYSGAPSYIGPDLNFGDFTTVAAFAEPCQPRRDAAGKVVVENFPAPMDGSDDAVLCDFLGGATLWIWKSILVDNNILKLPWWDSPSHGRHPALEKIYRPSQALSLTAAQRAALANDRHAPPLALPPITGTAVALPASTESPMNANLFDLFHPQRGTLVVVNDKYRDHAVQLVARLRNSLGEDIDDVSEDLEIIEGSSESPVGAYEVRACLNLEIESQGNLTLAHCRAAGSSGRARHMLVLGLLQVPNQLATLEQPRALARAGQAVARGAKSSLVAAKDAVVDAGKRKLGTGAKVLAEGSLVSGHEAVRRGAGAAIGMLTGRDPATVADNPLFQQAFNEASTGGMRFAAGLIERFAPGTAKVVRGAADSLEEGIDRKQATKVLDAAAPMVGRGLQALAQAAVAKFMPALAAPATAGALPPTPLAPTAAPDDNDGEDVEPARPRRRKPRVSKPKAARGETGGAA